jgi:hypothetical protein
MCVCDVCDKCDVCYVMYIMYVMYVMDNMDVMNVRRGLGQGLVVGQWRKPPALMFSTPYEKHKS